MNTKAAINKLVGILTKQNIVITKLAQQADANIKQYLEGAVVTSAGNSGITSQMTTHIESRPAQTLSNGATSEESYIVKVTFVPPLKDETQKQKFQTNFFKFIAVNRPELKLESGRVSLIFA